LARRAAERAMAKRCGAIPVTDPACTPNLGTSRAATSPSSACGDDVIDIRALQRGLLNVALAHL
jgi:hypothetical protein